MGIGTSNIGANIVEDSGERTQAAQPAAAGGKSAWSFLIGHAYAQDNNSGNSGNSEKQKFFRRW
jgi:hypothetical protein